MDYPNNRDFTQPLSLAPGVLNPAAGDLGPESVIFIKEEDSPNGKPLIVVGNEFSDTTTVFEINKVE